METKKFSRRDFLRTSAAVAASAALAACSPAATNAPTALPPTTVKPTDVPVVKPTDSPKPTDAPKPTVVPTIKPTPKVVTLDVRANQPEYINQERQIWDVFEAENPGIKINLFALNEPEEPAYMTKVAGGYAAHIDLNRSYGGLKKDNYQKFMDLSTIGFPWFDRWTWDIKNAWANKYKLSGPRCLDIYSGFLFTWQYNADLMAKAGLDPRKDVKTWEDFEKFMDAGTKWAASKDSGVKFFFDQGWLDGWSAGIITGQFSMQYANGQRKDQVDCWLGRKKFTDKDSAIRQSLQQIESWYKRGVLPANFWNRAFEDDSQASYISGKSVMINHGPWVWDKALAANPKMKQLGFPSTPPAAGNSVWTQYADSNSIEGTAQACLIPEGNQKRPEWEQNKAAFFWWFSPKVVKMRAEALATPVEYKLDAQLDLKGPQWQGIWKDIGDPKGQFPQVKWERGSYGDSLAAPYLKPGKQTGDVMEVTSKGIGKLWGDWLSGKTTIDDVLNRYQTNWEATFDVATMRKENS